MKRFAVALLICAALCAFCSCASTNSVHLRVFVPYSENGVSGTLYDDIVDFSADIITVDSLLKRISNGGRLEYSCDEDCIPVINGVGIYFDYIEAYYRCWTVWINGERDENGVEAHVFNGDEVEVVYELNAFESEGEK